MSFMREPNPWPPIRTGLPLLRAMDPWANYRKGPYAMHALSEYVGEARVNGALRALVEKKASSLATTLDLYRELQAVTPDPHKPLLADLFERNAFWTFDTERATAVRTPAGKWRVTMEVEARKVVAGIAGQTAKQGAKPRLMRPHQLGKCRKLARRSRRSRAHPRCHSYLSASIARSP